MDGFESLSHTRWECKYHVVFIAKCRRKTLYQELRKHPGEVFKKLAGCMENASATSWVSIFGREGISFRRWAEMRWWFEITSAIRSRKMSGWSRGTYGAERPPIGGPELQGRVSAPV
jgi:hypothetical protein